VSRIGLLLALAVAAAIGLVFAIRPELDVAASRLFFDPATSAFPLRDAAAARGVRDLAEVVLIVLVAPAAVILALKLIAPRRVASIPTRAAVFLVATVALGPGLLANAILKDHWGRPRPVAVTEFGGNQKFVAWWDPRGDCARNCSFVSGEASSAFWTVAPAVLAPPAWRAVALAAALVYGSAIGVLRMAAGAHFLTDVVFAGVLVFLVIWLAHGWCYRWRT
jgi:lipid A 4'-phosphatase